MLLPDVGPIAGLARDFFDPIVTDGARADDFIATALGRSDDCDADMMFIHSPIVYVVTAR